MCCTCRVSVQCCPLPGLQPVSVHRTLKLTVPSVPPISHVHTLFLPGSVSWPHLLSVLKWLPTARCSLHGSCSPVLSAPSWFGRLWVAASVSVPWGVRPLLAFSSTEATGAGRPPSSLSRRDSELGLLHVGTRGPRQAQPCLLCPQLLPPPLLGGAHPGGHTHAHPGYWAVPGAPSGARGCHGACRPLGETGCSCAGRR